MGGRMRRIVPCLWYTREAGEAAEFYKLALPDTRIKKISHFDEVPPEAGGIKSGDVMLVKLMIGDSEIHLLNGGPYYEHTPSVSLMVTVGSKEELDLIHQKLSPGGTALIEIGEYPFSPRYTFFSDKFGVHWQLIMKEGEKLKVTPTVIFGGEKQGLGPEAMEHYLSIFADSSVLEEERYKKNEGGIENSLKYSCLKIGESELVIMDAGNPSPMVLTGAISFVVPCKDQNEIDSFWEKIGAEGKEIHCGWIEDKFGVSWQVVPENLDMFINGPDKEKARRAMRAMLKMVKLDMDKIRSAYG